MASLTRLWHRLWCIPLNRNTVRESVDGVLGYRCPCGLWSAVVARYPDEMMAAVPRPAHERLKVKRTKLGLVRRRRA